MVSFDERESPLDKNQIILSEIRLAINLRRRILENQAESASIIKVKGNRGEGRRHHQSRTVLTVSTKIL